MLSTLAWFRAQLYQAKLKLVAEQLSNIPAGKVVRLEQPNHASPKFVPELKSRGGNDVRLEQLIHAKPKSVPELTFNAGNDVRPEQAAQVP